MPRRSAGKIFISHSSRDYLQATKVRDAARALEFEALLFHAPEVTDDAELLRRISAEIANRRFFVYLNSDNSGQSSWCAKERAIVAAHPRKSQFSFDIEAGGIRASSYLERFLRSCIVYIEAGGCGKQVTADRLAADLHRQDFGVASDLDAYLASGADWNFSYDAIQRETDWAQNAGIYLRFVDKPNLGQGSGRMFHTGGVDLVVSWAGDEIADTWVSDPSRKLVMAGVPQDGQNELISAFVWKHHHDLVRELQREYLAPL
jgi:hypothetical protein